MINKISKVTVYVNDQIEAEQFWVDKMHFMVVLKQEMFNGLTWLEVAPTIEAQTSFVLYDKQLMQKQNPDTNTLHPNIILSCNNIDETYLQLQQDGVKVDKLLKMPYGKMFKFYDQDGNQYLIRED